MIGFRAGTASGQALKMAATKLIQLPWNLIQHNASKQNPQAGEDHLENERRNCRLHDRSAGRMPLGSIIGSAASRIAIRDIASRNPCRCGARSNSDEASPRVIGQVFLYVRAAGTAILLDMINGNLAEAASVARRPHPRAVATLSAERTVTALVLIEELRQNTMEPLGCRRAHDDAVMQRDIHRLLTHVPILIDTEVHHYFFIGARCTADIAIATLELRGLHLYFRLILNSRGLRHDYTPL